MKGNFYIVPAYMCLCSARDKTFNLSLCLFSFWITHLCIYFSDHIEFWITSLPSRATPLTLPANANGKYSRNYIFIYDLSEIWVSYADGSASKCSLSQTLNLNGNEGWDFVICKTCECDGNNKPRSEIIQHSSVFALPHMLSVPESHYSSMWVYASVCVCTCSCLSSTYLWLHYLPAHTHSRWHTDSSCNAYVCVCELVTYKFST